MKHSNKMNQGEFDDVNEQLFKLWNEGWVEMLQQTNNSTEKFQKSGGRVLERTHQRFHQRKLHHATSQ